MLVCKIYLDLEQIAIVAIQEFGDFYRVEASVDHGSDVGLTSFALYDQPKNYSDPITLITEAFAILKGRSQILIEGDIVDPDNSTGASNLERQVRGPLPALPGETSSEVRDHRPTFRGQQQIQHGRDQLGQGPCTNDRQ